MNPPKYALLEIERRLRVAPELLPDLRATPFVDIEDRYLDCGRLRLRKMTSSAPAAPVFKLCKKYGRTGENEEPIVNVYLSQAEYEALLFLPGANLVKRRYRYAFAGRTFAIDVFQGSLAGLLLCEYEATSPEELAQISVPAFAVDDVTANPSFSGAALARASESGSGSHGL